MEIIIFSDNKLMNNFVCAAFVGKIYLASVATISDIVDFQNQNAKKIVKP